MRGLRHAAMPAVRSLPVRRLSMVDLGSARAEREVTSVLVIGDTATAQRVCATFTADSGRTVVHLVAPTDEQLAEAVSARVASAAILVHDDVAALRYAMSLGHLDPELPVTVAMFDRTIAGQLTKHLPHATIASPAALAAPSLAGPCLGRHVQATSIEGRAATTVMVRDGELIRTPHVLPRAGFLDRVRNWITWDHRHSDPGTKLMLIGLFGMCAILVIDIRVAGKRSPLWRRGRDT